MNVLVFTVRCLFRCTVVEPPELFHLSYIVDQPKVEVVHETPEPSETAINEKSGGKSSMKRAEAKPEPAEAKQEVKQPEGSKQETTKEKKDVDRPPIFVTLQ